MKPETSKLVRDLAVAAFSAGVSYWALNTMLGRLDPANSGGARKDAKAKSGKAIAALGLSVDELNLNEHEELIAAGLIAPDDIDVGFDDVGGLEPIISSLRESVIFPLCYPQLFDSASNLFGAPKGVLLYGPPGCGKTMLAKALAKESGARFLNLTASSLTDKWFGESNKLVAATFSLARKLQPTIIFIDEIDSFMRERRSSDHEVTAMMKAEFMTLWDGLSTTSSTRILVLGATNRPNDIDSAIIRRMPKRFSVKLPDTAQRLKILQLMLKDVELSPKFDMNSLVRSTDGFSGSELKEACRGAAMMPVREYMRKHATTDGKLNLPAAAEAAMTANGAGVPGIKAVQQKLKMRPLELKDFEAQRGHDTIQADGLD